MEVKFFCAVSGKHVVLFKHPVSNIVLLEVYKTLVNNLHKYGELEKVLNMIR